MMDNIIAIILAAHLLLSLVAGMALKLYELTPEQDVYQREGFGIVLLTVTILCVVLGILSIIAGTPCIRGMVSRIFIKKKDYETTTINHDPLPISVKRNLKFANFVLER